MTLQKLKKKSSDRKGQEKSTKLGILTNIIEVVEEEGDIEVAEEIDLSILNMTEHPKVRNKIKEMMDLMLKKKNLTRLHYQQEQVQKNLNQHYHWKLKRIWII